jgi:hypothetical protein
LPLTPSMHAPLAQLGHARQNEPKYPGAHVHPPLPLDVQPGAHALQVLPAHPSAQMHVPSPLRPSLQVPNAHPTEQLDMQLAPYVPAKQGPSQGPPLGPV